MSGRLKPYFYFVLRVGAILDSVVTDSRNPSMVVGIVNTSARISPSELTMETIVLIFRDIVTNETIITNTSNDKYVMLYPQCALLLSFYINRLAVFN